MVGLFFPPLPSLRKTFQLVKTAIKNRVDYFPRKGICPELLLISEAIIGNVGVSEGCWWKSGRLREILTARDGWVALLWAGESGSYKRWCLLVPPSQEQSWHYHFIVTKALNCLRKGLDAVMIKVSVTWNNHEAEWLLFYFKFISKITRELFFNCAKLLCKLLLCHPKASGLIFRCPVSANS